MGKGRHMSDGERFKEYLIFQIHRNIVNLYKSHLLIVEDLRKDHNIMLRKLQENLPKEYVENINYFDDEKYDYIRKKTLDIGNNAIRDFENNIENLEVSLKKHNKK